MQYKYKLKRCLKKECCKRCIHVKFKAPWQNGMCTEKHTEQHKTRRTPRPSTQLFLFFIYNFLYDECLSSFSNDCLFTNSEFLSQEGTFRWDGELLVVFFSLNRLILIIEGLNTLLIGKTKLEKVFSVLWGRSFTCELSITTLTRQPSSSLDSMVHLKQITIELEWLFMHLVLLATIIVSLRFEKP